MAISEARQQPQGTAPGVGMAMEGAAGTDCARPWGRKWKNARHCIGGAMSAGDIAVGVK